MTTSSHTRRSLRPTSGIVPGARFGQRATRREQTLAPLLRGGPIHTENTSGGLRTAHWRVGYATECGARHRERQQSNQDALGVRAFEDGMLIAAVADGVGQGARGDIAAKSLVQHWLDTPHPFAAQPSPAWLARPDGAVQSALARATARCGAATGAALWLDPHGNGWVTRIGDCRVYRISPTSGSEAGCDEPPSLRALLPDQSYRVLGEAPPANSAPHHPARMAGTGCVGNDASTGEAQQICGSEDDASAVIIWRGIKS